MVSRYRDPKLDWLTPGTPRIYDSQVANSMEYCRIGIERMKGNASELWSRPGFLVRRLHQISVAIFLEEMAGLEITPVQYGALMIVAADPGIDQSALAAELGIDSANA